MTGPDVFPFILTFTDTIRRSCIRVVIEDDALYESEKSNFLFDLLRFKT